jgi:hypothetical protein
MHDTERCYPELYRSFVYLDVLLIKIGSEKMLQLNSFVENFILYHLRRSAPQSLKLWPRNLQNTRRIKKQQLFEDDLKLEKCPPYHSLIGESE